MVSSPQVGEIKLDHLLSALPTSRLQLFTASPPSLLQSRAWMSSLQHEPNASHAVTQLSCLLRIHPSYFRAERMSVVWARTTRTCNAV